MNYLSELQLINNLAFQITKARLTYYTEDLLNQYLRKYSHINYTKIKPINQYNQNLQGSLFTFNFNQYKSQITLSHKICIIFLHGLGSNRLQGLNLLNQLPYGYSLCVFDFSGNGKSQGKCIAYGLKQKEDIKCIINYLKKRYNFNKFVLWGRSMGAVAALLYEKFYKNNRQVILMILDSPFSSFQRIVKQIVKKKSNIPQFITNLVIDVLKKKYLGTQFNPFNINFEEISFQCCIPTLFIYSQNDQIVSYQHSIRIIQHFKGKYEKLIINQKHNILRNSNTLKSIYNIIQTYAFKSSSKKNKVIRYQSKKSLSMPKSRGIVVTSLQKYSPKIQSQRNQSINLTNKYQSTVLKRDSVIFNGINFYEQKVGDKNSLYQKNIFLNKTLTRRNSYKIDNSSRKINSGIQLF